MKSRKVGPYTVWITAFGEENTARGWAQDPRCVHHDPNLISSRVRSGVDAEDAIVTPRLGGKTDLQDPVVPKVATQEYTSALTRPLTAYGQTRPISEWLNDLRCQWDSAMAIAARLDNGFPGELALKKYPYVSGKLYEAFGEFKSMSDWSRDKRCLYTRPELRRRMTLGMSFEKAMSSPLGFLESPKKDRYRFSDDLVKAFGEAKTVRDWASDERCVVNVDILRRRIRDGWPIERALSAHFIDSEHEAW